MNNITNVKEIEDKEQHEHESKRPLTEETKQQFVKQAIKEFREKQTQNLETRHYNFQKTIKQETKRILKKFGKQDNATPPCSLKNKEDLTSYIDRLIKTITLPSSEEPYTSYKQIKDKFFQKGNYKKSCIFGHSYFFVM